MRDIPQDEHEALPAGGGNSAKEALQKQLERFNAVRDRVHDEPFAASGGAFSPPREPDSAIVADAIQAPPARRLRGAEYVEALQRSSSPQDFSVRTEELAAAIGYRDPVAAARRARAEREQRQARELEETAQRERARQLVREQIGEWTKDSAKRLAQTKPATEREQRDAKKLGPHVWAVSRLTCCGSLADLAYAIQQMMAAHPIEAVGAWVIEAMGLRADGIALRQLHSSKARRKLARSYVQWNAGDNMRLRQIAGSPSRRTVRGVRRLPQKLLARVTAIGGRPWHRSTTTRDANEAHAAGLWRRVRMPLELAHESERCGPSKQVVSRYWMELPRQPKRTGRSDAPTQLAGFLEHRGADSSAPDAFAWVREQAQQALVYATHAVLTIRSSLERACVAGLLLPLQTAAPPA